MSITGVDRGVQRDSQPLPWGRVLVLLGAGVALLSGMIAALLRLGVQVPPHSLDLANLHGTVMVFGFLGTAITLERAVALQSSRRRGSRIAYVAPVASVAGTVIALIQVATLGPEATRFLPAGAWAVSMGALFLIYVAVWRRQPSIAVLIQGLGAVSGMGGILLWGRGFEVAQIIPWWCAFLVLTIVGERLELARVGFARAATEVRILAETLALVIGLVLTLFIPSIGYPVMGGALLILIVDMATHDVARVTVRTAGLTRFMAACMLAGYAWAAVAGSVWLLLGPVYSGFGYDTVVHAIMIGFALSMVMAHAPVIVPAIVRRRLPYAPVMWGVWALLQCGLAIRVVAGIRNFEGVWQFGGALGVVALLAFIVTTVSLVVVGSRAKVTV